MTEKQQLDAELTAVLKHLPGWRLDPKYNDHWWAAHLIDGTGRGIFVNATRIKGRFVISGTWPKDKEGRDHLPENRQHITVARGRSAEKIATDIERRFLGWYEAAYKEQLDKIARHADSRSRQQEATAALAELLGPRCRQQTNSSPCQIYAGNLTVDVHNGGTSEPQASLKLSYVSLKVAKAMIRAYVMAGGLAE